MDKINSFFRKRMYFALFIFTFSITFGLFFILLSNSKVLDEKSITSISFMMGFTLGCIVPLMVWLFIRNDEFWRDFKILEEKVEKAEFKNEIRDLHSEFILITKKAYGRPHVQSLKQIYAIMELKFKLLPENI
jgi:ABC-type sugar transport system permease subunit